MTEYSHTVASLVFVCSYVICGHGKCGCNSLMLFPNTLYIYHAAVKQFANDPFADTDEQ